MTTISDYDEREVAAARKLLESLEELFGPYLDAMSIVGGWVPEKRIPDPEEPHIGSTDVDVALDRSRLSGRDYQDIHDRLRRAGFSRTFSSFTYTRAVQIDDGDPVVVELDLLDGFGERRGDLRPMKAEAAPLAVAESSVPPESTAVRITSLAAFVVMKGLAMRGRNKLKDPYDIYFCLRNHPAGSQGLATALRRLVRSDLAREALVAIRKQFRSPADRGPKKVAEFLEEEGEDAELVQRDAYERVNAMLIALGL